MITLQAHTRVTSQDFSVVTLYDDGATEVERYAFQENAERAFAQAMRRENASYVYICRLVNGTRRVIRQGRAH